MAPPDSATLTCQRSGNWLAAPTRYTALSLWTPPERRHELAGLPRCGSVLFHLNSRGSLVQPRLLLQYVQCDHSQPQPPIATATGLGFNAPSFGLLRGLTWSLPPWSPLVPLQLSLNISAANQSSFLARAPSSLVTQIIDSWLVSNLFNFFLHLDWASMPLQVLVSYA
ncbi:hypothetical protein THAOC_02738 [Thalassiosira oceanica]|uniref:Uncharacterized protein n=1 Tax=Thalassiosira oceanica TaxID=159749 RepID=K0TEI2_THAOC|nr:hypothetical protein THAOC_02738 [Thalassiosira oceanica]|eukprot:EJK75534.1 hypothetical protein THAOC_02738 [Thalassiosira oceanica]